jgi:integrase
MTDNLRGLGRVFQRTFKDRKTGQKKLMNTWWIEFHHKGKQVRKASGSTKRSMAIRMLREHLDASTSGKLVVGRGERFRFDDLTELLRRDYRLNKRRSMDRAERAIHHLKSHFGDHRALDISDHELDAYVDQRMTIDEAANASVNYEIAMLRRMYRLAGKVLGGYRPEFPKIRVSNTRKGFFEEPDFCAMLERLNPWMQPPVQFAYLTGWRLRSEVLTLQWPQVDFEAGEVRLEPGTTKNDEGRTFPFAVLPELERLLRAQRERTDALQRATGRIIPWVFHHNGERIREYRGSWDSAIAKAGLPGKIPHDLRRTAVRNLERACVPRSVAMKLVGHKTESIYRRYAIVAKQDLVDGLKRLADYRASLDKAPADPKVVPISSAGSLQK